MTSSLLDNPIWHALSTAHSSFAEGDNLAKRYPPAVTPLGATLDQSAASFASMARLLPPGGAVGLFVETSPSLPLGWTILRQARLNQMVASKVVTVDAKPAEDLKISDVDEALALVELTNPGPFGRRTFEMGRYIGIRDNGRLVAMAGERLRLPGYTEVSAVCTHPNYRGRGYAASLVATLVRAITERNEVPFLHVATENSGAIRVYERLGFTTRCEINLAVVKRDGPSSK